MTAHTLPDVPWTRLDAAIAMVSPSRARRRYAQKVAVANMRRAYDAGHKGRLTDGWTATGTAADAEIAAAGGILRDRMRDLVRNNPLAANCIQVLVSSMVGPGIRPRAMTGDPEVDKEINALFERWSKQCDAHGHTDFHGLINLAVREMLEGGDCFAIKKPLRRAPSREVPLQIELREADHLDSGKWLNGNDGGKISNGIEYDQSGKRTHYWMFPDHPGDTSSNFRRSLVSEKVPASSVAHLFERQRVQSRGVPWGAPAMRALQDLGDWQVAEMVRKKTEACTVGVVIGEDPDGNSGLAPSIVDVDGNEVEGFEPGMFAYMRGGKDVKFNTPGHSGGVREWNTVQMHLIAAGFRVPYALATTDLREANFASSRVGINEFRRMVTQVQWLIIIPMMCQRIWDWFTMAAWTAGKIKSPVVPVEWSPPKFESVNPWQDAQTDLLETRAGFVSLPEQIAKRGYNFEDVMGEFVKTIEQLDAANLIFDSDPRKVTKAGLGHANPPGNDDPPPNSSGTTSE